MNQTAEPPKQTTAILLGKLFQQPWSSCTKRLRTSRRRAPRRHRGSRRNDERRAERAGDVRGRHSQHAPWRNPRHLQGRQMRKCIVESQRMARRAEPLHAFIFVKKDVYIAIAAEDLYDYVGPTTPRQINSDRDGSLRIVWSANNRGDNRLIVRE